MPESKKLTVKKSFSQHSSLSKRKFFRKTSMVSLPNLIEVQKNSYNWFLEEGLKQNLEEVSPLADFTSKEMELSFGEYYLDEPKYDEFTAQNKNVSYEAPLRVKVSLLFKKTGEVREQEIFLTDFPLMTEKGTFIVNGIERVVISQIIRSPGVFFSMNYQKGKKLFGAKIIPNKGAWFEFETDYSNVLWVKIDRRRKLPVTSLLKIFGLETEEDIIKEFKDADNGEVSYIRETLNKDITKTTGEAYKEIYKRLRPGDLATQENAKQIIDGMFFSFDRYDLSQVGRYRMNARLGISKSEFDEKDRLLSKDELITIIKEVIKTKIMRLVC
jgi:DNA-directed RNA polymerase subunit beta